MGVSFEAGPQRAVNGRNHGTECLEEDPERAERLGVAWLQRYRRIEGSSLLPSVEPLNELLLGLDFFANLREEDVRCLPAAGASMATSGDEDKEKEALMSEVETEDEKTETDCDPSVQQETGRRLARSRRGCEAPLQAIPTVIRNERQYVGFFLPLFLQEAKQALARAIKLDFGPAEEFVQMSGEPSGPFLSLLLSRSGSGAAASVSACRYCHGDLVLLYVPAKAAENAGQKASSAPGGEKSKGSADPQSGEEGSSGGAESASGGPADETDVQATSKPLRARDTDCHALAVVSQGQHESITVRLLTPSVGQAATQATGGQGQKEGEPPAIYNPATGLPDGFMSPRDRRRMVKLARAINAQLTCWTVHRIMSLTTLHREFQGLMSLPDLLLKNSLFRQDTSGGRQRQSVKSKMLGPFNNPLLEGEDSGAKEAASNGDSSTTAADLSLSPQQAASEANSAAGKEGGEAQAGASVGSSAGPTANPSSHSVEEAIEDSSKSTSQEEERRLVIPDALRARLESIYNASQLAALEDSLKVEGVTLIQGPPGTGKTSTIVGVVSVILHAQLQGQQLPHGAAHSVRPEPSALGGGELASLRAAQSKARSKSRPWLQPDYAAWMDADELALEDLDCQLMLQPAAVPTDPPVRLTRERHELQPVRVLVCAPSNAAIDEIVKRLTADPETGGGIFDGSGQRFSPAVVRVGPNVHPDLLQHSLQYKALQRLRARGATNFAALATAKADVLRDSLIVCATISVCGSNDLTSLADCFDTVVVDEASQAVELATLIPLRLGCRRLILVGDPKQLPATIFSRVAINLRYDRSLFQRLEGAGQHTNMLSQQYRMHPAISRFASVSFYDGLLRDAPHLPNGLWTPFPFWHRLPVLQPLVFFNLDGEHTGELTSLVNYAEADFVRQLVDFLRRLFIASGNAKWEHRLAVISPYAQQVVLLRRTIKALLGIPEGKSCPVDVNTVDGFQGQEKDFIIFSAVRGVRSDREEAKRGTVGFLGDMRRLNVAVTRGRVNLWLVGNGCFLRRDKTWARLYTYAKDRQALISINRRNAQHGAILTKWALKYCKTHHRERKLLEEHAPRFLADLAESHKALREKKQKRGAKEDDEQGDELQTEGPVSWEQPIEGEPDERGTDQEMTTFHDVADEGCLDEAAIQILLMGIEPIGITANSVDNKPPQRDKALEDAEKVEPSLADARSRTAEKIEDTATPQGANPF
ncbi:hypothetical protein Esti_005019 [Eimeria stiedai]